MVLLLFASLLACIGIGKATGLNEYAKKQWQQLKKKGRRNNINSIFDEHFIEPKAFYWKEFNALPSMSYIGGIDSVRIIERIKENKYGKVQSIHQRNYYNWQAERIDISKTLFRLDNKMVIRLGEDWMDMYYGPGSLELAKSMLEEFKSLRAPQKEGNYEINIISLNSGVLDLKTLAIKPTKLDISLFFNDDFIEFDNIIRSRLEKENDKGIVLLHGLPGTGKTSYLRFLVGTLKKKVMFVSPSVAGNLMNPDFMDLLIDNPNSILVIEDAENIIMDRRFSSQSHVSNLLNISDGLLSDCLNVQIICTFNSELSFVDSALLRKGRLIAKYEFGKLDLPKARALRAHFGLQQPVDRPMTLAEIANPQEKEYQLARVEVMGFKRHVMEN